MKRAIGFSIAREPNENAGFAIVLTLVVVALLVALVTSLATLAKIEGNLASRSLRQATARQHALMAAQLALGQLQAFAGPDPRVTATAGAYGGGAGTSHYTGVWSTDVAGTTANAWLVSGGEDDPSVLTPTDAIPTVELVGVATSGVRDDVRVPLLPILAKLRLGESGPTTMGHIAWWIGDEGVKASVTAEGTADRITYAPYDSEEQRRRLVQQLPLGAGAVDAAGQSIFETRTGENLDALSRMLSFDQISFLSAASEGAAVGRDAIRPYFHAWTTDHAAVLADTRNRGLRRDLSLKPDLLGSAFAEWTDYPHYMEDPRAPLSPTESPVYPADAPADSMRRRYRMTAPYTSSGITHGVAPVLSYFLLTFNVRTDQSVSGIQRPLEVRARWLVSLWNPLSSALVPEDLTLEVANLPSIQVMNDSDGTSSSAISLDALYGAPLRFRLPWQTTGRDDQQSWLPGRVHTWAAKEDLNKGYPVPADGFASVFYTRTLSAAAGQGVQRAVSGATMANTATARLLGGPAQLTAKLYRASSAGGRELLGEFVSPAFSAFNTTPAAINLATYQFSFVFHLAESADTPATPDAWLGVAGQDPREPTLPAGSFIAGPNGPRPELYQNYTAVAFSDRLLDRALPGSAGSTTGQSYNEDAPLFELPRAPLLSLGALQHLHTAETRLLAIGNSWGGAAGWNALFDRYFFSGLTAAIDLSGWQPDVPLPNRLLRITGRRADGTTVSVNDLRDEAASGYSSKFLLQGGAFNINSINPAAWRAVLMSARRLPSDRFDYLDASAATGTASDARPATAAFAGAAFFRFSHSAAETFKADAGYAASTTAPPAAPNVASPANTHLFRRGVRVLAADQLTALAEAIATLVRQEHEASGPFRSIEEFLAPSALFSGASLLERAIGQARGSDGKAINDRSLVPEFSSQWLTQGDVLTVLAPVLFARSDTFRIRTYGDAVNPVSGQLEGRAWAEVMVQRVPDYVDPSQDAAISPANLNPTNQRLGRRFKIISFRWLDHSDL